MWHREKLPPLQQIPCSQKKAVSGKDGVGADPDATEPFRHDAVQTVNPADDQVSPVRGTPCAK